MSDLVLSYIRTFVPVGVATVLTWLASKYGIILPEEMSTQLAIAVTGLVIGIYYAIVRGLESRWPWFGKLLGAARQPEYQDKTT